MGNVLLTNGQLRKTLSAVRTLGNMGIDVAAAESTIFNPAAFSKYCRRPLVYPEPGKYSEKFYRWLEEAIIKYRFDVVFPMDDDVLEIVINNSEKLGRLCKFVVPEKESYETASDKGEAVRLAMSAGVRCPATFFPDSIDEALSISKTIACPLVIKPRKSSGSRGIRLVNSADEFEKQYREIHNQYPLPIIQECLGRGSRYDVCMLFDRESRLKACFTQREVRHFPVDMGPSTVQESVIFPEAVDAAKKIMDKLKWKGIVEIEFMVDSRDGKLKFMEINPRFWNSLHTAIVSGINFPWLLYKISLGEDVKESFDYKEGIVCRNLLPGDILHFLFNRDRKNMEPPFFKRIEDDIISPGDPLPVLGFILACLRYLPDIRMWKLMFER